MELADLSLRDYQWRSDIFKSNEAERKLEESLARMMGEETTYIRPMDAGDDKRGPLGQAEKKAVTWLSSVIEEEGSRARLITSLNGTLIRPMEVGDWQSSTAGGPLASLERAAVSFLTSIKTSENERVINRLLRPMDVSEDKRGPLGEAEAKVVKTLSEIKQSEKMRAQMATFRNETVRPMDVPGPLGEAEKLAVDFVVAERKRVLEQKTEFEREKVVVRPRDARLENPLGVLERKFEQSIKKLQVEEEERLKNIKEFMVQNRPMEVNEKSALGLMEAFMVAVLRVPLLILSISDRVWELMQSEKLDLKTYNKEKIVETEIKGNGSFNEDLEDVNEDHWG